MPELRKLVPAYGSGSHLLEVSPRFMPELRKLVPAYGSGSQLLEVSPRFMPELRKLVPAYGSGLHPYLDLRASASMRSNSRRSQMMVGWALLAVTLSSHILADLVSFSC